MHVTFTSPSVALQEAAACRTIAARGVLLVATAHGSSLSDLLSNPDLRDLVGGVKAVSLGDQLARSSNMGHKVCISTTTAHQQLTQGVALIAVLSA
jgi:stage III sporulation protein SpoIIIAA